MSEILRGLTVAGLFLAIFGLAELLKRLLNPPPEFTRKFVHFAGGLVVAAFPWLLTSAWTVLALSLSMGSILWLSRRLGLLSSVHGVERRSEGGLYYPLAVFLLFWLSHDRPVFYLISALALVLSDTLAALVGTVYGRHPYRVEGDTRSLEGSAVFFLATFLGAHVPLLLMTDLDRGLCVLVALQMALLATAFEAISLQGNDNLIVPLASYFFLLKLTDKTPAALGVQIAAFLICLLVCLLLAGRVRLFSLAGAVGASLVLYGAFSLGGPAWALAPSSVLLGYFLLRQWFQASPDEHQVLAVFWVSVVPTLLLLANNWLTTTGTPGDPLFYPFVGTVAAQFAILIDLERRELFLATLVGLLTVVPLSVWLHPASGFAWTALLPAVAGPSLYHLWTVQRGLPEGVAMVRRQALATLGPALLAAVIQTSAL